MDTVPANLTAAVNFCARGLLIAVPRKRAEANGGDWKVPASHSLKDPLPSHAHEQNAGGG